MDEVMSEKSAATARTFGGMVFLPTNEITRTYEFGHGKRTVVSCPAWVHVKISHNGETHHIIDSQGRGHTISPGWLRIEWDVAKGVSPF